MKKNNKKNWLEVCPKCGKGKPALRAIKFEIRARAAIEHWRCQACGQPIINFRRMTDAEMTAEAKRILAAEAERKAAEAAKAQREADEMAAWERERAEIIMQQRRIGR